MVKLTIKGKNKDLNEDVAIVEITTEDYDLIYDCLKTICRTSGVWSHGQPEILERIYGKEWVESNFHNLEPVIHSKWVQIYNIRAEKVETIGYFDINHE